MLGEEDKKNRLPGSGSSRKTYLRSVSWSDRSPTKPISNPRPQNNSKARSCLPPLQPLSIARRNVEEWPRAGSDDLGIWPHPQTPRPSVNPPENSNSNSNSEQEVREFQFKRDKLAFYDKECSRIAEHIYLGSDAVAKNREILRKNGITHVLNCVGFVCPEYFKIDLVYKTLWLQDSPSEDITSILYDVFDYFEDVREQGGRVLVHCCQGVSRSTSLVIAYLMWREGQSFEDAFQFVKAARGVTNPNMGFACQLLQCQKRVHAVPVSPNSMVRMYRMAPHSPYDPLHLVPKMINHPSTQALDSRGAFILHVPSAIYVWSGKNCSSVMSKNARAAAFQVIRYERAKGPICNIEEGEEPAEFWDALSSGQPLVDDCSKVEVKKKETWSPGSDKASTEIRTGVGERKLDEYDLDFELFHKALAGGVVPPFSVSNMGSETCLPARENGWSRLRRKFAMGGMKELVMSSKVNCETTPSNDVSTMSTDTHKEGERLPHCPERIVDTSKQVEHSVTLANPLSSPTPPCGSPDSVSCFRERSTKFNSKSPTLSPSTSDYASSFTFSPSSSNWSDLSYFSSRQPSPSGLDSTDPFFVKTVPLLDTSNIPYKENTPSSPETFYANPSLRGASPCTSGKGIAPSIAERRGSNPPPLMLLPSIDEPPPVPRNLVRSWSFSIPDEEDDVMEDTDFSQSENEDDGDEVMLEANCRDEIQRSKDEKEDGKSYISSGEIDADVTTSVLYELPSFNKIGSHSIHILDSKSAYILLAPDVGLGKKYPGILFLWLGSKILHEDGWNHSDTSENGVFNLETIGHNFLSRLDLPLNTPLQINLSAKYGNGPYDVEEDHYPFNILEMPLVEIVREGEEPEQFLNHLSHILLAKMDDRSYG
ncbi:hypothetical protein FEM48_Zijuj10G0057200 [Ziziphus jujuba var. spinosa]|uniref:Protein-tyrosine-phosphatase MKP1-like n=1 Tax=Ziziphus jujuba var. spinosa TaxID=714518 RepID=A0A978ULM6_ZIZJJ|nr:hypothetical protein FEM48_Zijuj10G0057200 [Ziziphus jujuba var. spinosa]